MSLKDVRWIDIPHVSDPRGVLSAVEGGIDVPFEIKRIFYMCGTPEGTERGGHAHRETHQVVLGLNGSFRIDLSDGTDKRSFNIDDSNRGLYMPPMTWARLYGFSPGAIALVLADTHYDRSKSLRTWDDFALAVRTTRLNQP
jgi:dTDP-4-dehydrorhamnose 3,5-epimerase-like enzyme